MKRLLLIFLLLIARPVSATVTIETKDSAAADGVYTLTFSGVTIAGTDPYLVVGCGQSTGGGSDITGVTWKGSENLVPVENIHNGNTTRLAVFDLVPTTGTGDIVITEDNTQQIGCGYIVLNGADQTTPRETSTSAYDPNTGTITIDVPSDSGELVLDFVSFKTNPPGSPGAGQSIELNEPWYLYDPAPLFNDTFLVSSKAGAVGTVNMTWDDVFVEWASIGISVIPSAGSPPPPTRRKLNIQGSTIE